MFTYSLYYVIVKKSPLHNVNNPLTDPTTKMGVDHTSGLGLFFVFDIFGNLSKLSQCLILLLKNNCSFLILNSYNQLSNILWVYFLTDEHVNILNKHWSFGTQCTSTNCYCPATVTQTREMSEIQPNTYIKSDDWTYLDFSWPNKIARKQYINISRPIYLYLIFEVSSSQTWFFVYFVLDFSRLHRQ